MGCGGICGKFNDGICMGACSMDEAGRTNYVKVLESRVAKQEAKANTPTGTTVLKPLNPGAHAFLNEPKAKPKVHKPEEQIAPLTQGDTEFFSKMKL